MASESGFERWNTHFSMCVEQEVMGRTLRLNQDPNSEHLGTTVWDASIVLAKYLEKNARKGDLSRAKVRGKRAIELGAGMGLGGMAFAMLGADVWLTDVKEVMPLLKANYEQNISPAACRACDGGKDLAANVGKVTVMELDWSMEHQRTGLQAPFDFILAADCIYHEHLLDHLFDTIVALSDAKTTILIANERRSESVQAAFFDRFAPTFTFKKVPLGKMDAVHQHPAIEIYVLKRKKAAQSQRQEQLQEQQAAAELGQLQLDAASASTATDAADPSTDHHAEALASTSGCSNSSHLGGATAPAPDEHSNVPPQRLSSEGRDVDGLVTAGEQCQMDPPPSAGRVQPEWSTRRQGAMAARLMAAVRIPGTDDAAV